MKALYRDGARTREVEVSPEGGGRYRVTVDGVEIQLAAEALEGGRLRMVTAEGVTIAEVTPAGSRRFVRLGTLDFVVDREAGRARRGAAVGGGLEAPMPGVVTKVLVAAGDTVKKGQPLVAVEAMKMEHAIRAPRDGVIARVNARVGDMVAGGAALVAMEDEGEE
jgi:3-methylcrotonyl-CoA carboxylase alpha subunit